MQISYLGVELHRVRRQDLALVQKWRNQLQVRQFMRHQRLITSSEQLKWFARTQSTSNLCFVLRLSEKSVALLQISDIDYKVGCAEVGIFLGEEEYRGTYLPWLGSCTLLCFAFEILKLHQLRATVSKHNKVSLQYNDSLGFRRVAELDEQFFCYSLSVTDLQKAILSYRRLLRRLTEQPLCLFFLPEERALQRFICDRAALRVDPEGKVSCSCKRIGLD